MGSWGDTGGTPSLTPVLGGWNATTNTPAITSSIGTEGDAYQVLTAGTTSIDGIADWGLLDFIWYDGAVWRKLDHSPDGATPGGPAGGALSGTYPNPALSVSAILTTSELM